MKINKSTPVAVCALITRNAGKEILAVSRKDNPEAFGLPGGKVDPGETEIQAIIREMKEETGLVFTNPVLVYSHNEAVDKNGVQYWTMTFTGEISGEIQTCETGVVAWVPKKTLTGGPFGKYNTGLFNAVGL